MQHDPTPATDHALVPSPATAGPVADDPVLAAAAKVFAITRGMSGIAAAFFGYVQAGHYYETAGFAKMEDYAKAKLGLRSNGAIKKTSRASISVWENYRSQADEAVQAVLAAPDTFVSALPNLPNETLLVELSSALDRVTLAERFALRADVLAGKDTAEELRALKPKAKAANQAGGTKTGDRVIKSLTTCEELLNEPGGLSRSQCEEIAKKLAACGVALEAAKKALQNEAPAPKAPNSTAKPVDNDDEPTKPPRIPRLM